MRRSLPGPEFHRRLMEERFSDRPQQWYCCKKCGKEGLSRKEMSAGYHTLKVEGRECGGKVELRDVPQG